MTEPAMRDGGARRLLNDLIAQVAALASAVAEQASNMFVAQQLERLTEIRDRLATPSRTLWNAMANGGAQLLNSSAALLRSAPGAGLRTYVTNLQVQNANALSGVTVQVLDDTTPIWSWYLAPGGSFSGPVNLVSTANKPLNVKLSATLATSGVVLNAQGYVAA